MRTRACSGSRRHMHADTRCPLFLEHIHTGLFGISSHRNDDGCLGEEIEAVLLQPFPPAGADGPLAAPFSLRMDLFPFLRRCDHRELPGLRVRRRRSPHGRFEDLADQRLTTGINRRHARPFDQSGGKVDNLAYVIYRVVRHVSCGRAVARSGRSPSCWSGTRCVRCCRSG